MEISEIIKKDEVVKRKKGRPRKEINKDVEQKFPEEKKKRGRKKKEVVMEESFYSPPSVLENHQKVANESKIVATLQDKMDELNQLSEEATEINTQLNFSIK